MLRISHRRRSYHIRAAIECLEHRQLLAFTPAPIPDSTTGNTLRAAITAANLTTATDTIVLQAGNYDLSIPNSGGQENQNQQGDLDIHNSLIIQGAGAGVTFINAHNIDRVFHISGAASVTIQNLTITGGL